ncbi:6-phosphogluconolactonase [Nocardioides coralli]|uniref:6-phosphogluconolactonase n=1 Tax=Nocardioides coralli TaxID=2872154 RepID=UPI001CA3EE89|nr:6-phosphogluconolactonase [Nocardioides coralli]QZY30668.1 6-phosphogluconolactonase [Nocardioides coralli]
MITRVEVFEDADSLAAAVAGELLTRLATAQARGDEPDVVLTGGSIAERIHGVLGRHAPDAQVDWSRVGVWWGDERYVAADSPDRNAGQARQAFLEHVPVDASRVHEAPAADSGMALADAAAAYGAALEESGTGVFEVLMLGIGPDGHVASLFPGHAALAVEDRSVVAVPDSPKPPPERISLTLPALNRSRAVWFVASGEGKAEAVARALADDGSVDQTPARGVTGMPDGSSEVVWFLDRAAASHL